ncbi:membrane associated protein [[Clostridium] sordellii]|uniref:NusG domain II-containing protein n=1 Tax=Paraclostridium sordellii TaxID=1505 RepID=UPI0005DCD254|nr:NusG domain II-containing protein [Paeniclostridium sordellii]CEP91460.1 membrane associated protein [[Clostridium] sordellii] [Paeniclostridium sordellii]
MNKKFKIVQIVIILLILIGSIGAYFFINNKKVENPVANIYKNGKLVKSIKLKDIKDDYEIKIGDDKHFNIIKVSKGGIKVVKSNCYDKVCMKTGEIHDSLLPIACLPNNLIIKIEGAKYDEFDTKSH